MGATTTKLAVNTGPMRLAELAQMVHRVTDELVARCVAREEQAGRRLSCRAGCGKCCNQIVPMSGPEALFLVDHVMARPEAEQDEVIARYEAVAAAVDKGGFTAQLSALAGDLSQVDLAGLAAEYYALEVPCFLLSSGSCRYYEARPTICRLYNVTTPAEWCADRSLGRPRTVPMPGGMSQPLAAAMAQLTGQAEELVPLNRVFDWVRDHPDLYQRRWPGLELFEALVAQLPSP